MENFAPSSRSEESANLEGRTVCVVYDCLFPLTHGGAERWYRVLVDHLVASGAKVTYLTRRQWEAESPEWAGVDVVAVSGASELYDAEGTRRTIPALAFGFGTLTWMVRHRHAYDAVIVASFPFFSLLAIRAALVGTGIPVLVDYHELWSSKYWRVYAGPITGAVGATVQQLCVRLSRIAQVFTEESARRLRADGFRGDVAVLPGLLASEDKGHVDPTTTPPESPMVLFVGRHVKHKGVRQLPEIFAAARTSIPTLRMTVVSDGPERAGVESDVARLGLAEFVSFTGAVPERELRRLYGEASCTVVPSLREGYGIVVAESISAGTPVVVADNPENLATSLVEPGVNGFVVDSSIRAMAQGIVEAVLAGPSLRLSTATWNEQHSTTKSMDRSADEMLVRVSRFARRTGTS